MKLFKKTICIFIIFSLFITGCSSLELYNLKNKKPSKSYYTEKLLSCFEKDDNCEINVLYTNFYKGKRINKGETLIIRKFFKYQKNDSFITNPKNLPKNPEYKLFLTFKKDKFVIDVYNDKLISVYPWDGNLEKDYISMENTYVSYNLFNLCKYVIDKSKE